MAQIPKPPLQSSPPTPPPVPPSPNSLPSQAATSSLVPGRDDLATIVILGSMIFLVILSLAAAFANTATNIEKVFTMLVPVIATWVGTVLAFYFGGKNFDSAAKTMQQMVTTITQTDKLRKYSAQEVMTPFGQMTVYTLKSGTTLGSVNLKSEILPKLQGRITRIPIVDDKNAILYMIHRSIIDRFLGDIALSGQVADPSQANLEQFISHDSVIALVGPSTLAFVNINANLAEAKSAMDAVPGCQDVFVTQTGQKSEPILGWLSNTKIAKYSAA